MSSCNISRTRVFAPHGQKPNPIWMRAKRAFCASQRTRGNGAAPPRGSFDCAQDFGSGLRRPLNASTSTAKRRRLVMTRKFYLRNSRFPSTSIRAGSRGRLSLREYRGYFSQWILISFSKGLNSMSPVTSSAFFSLAKAAANASAKLILKRALKSAAVSAKVRVVQ